MAQQEPGFKKILFTPTDLHRLDHAATYDSIRAPSRLSGRIKGGTVSMTYQIPPNCNAKLILPTQVDKIIGGMSEKVVAADDGRELRMSSGTHQLTLPLNPK